MTSVTSRASVRQSLLLLVAGAMDPVASSDTQASCWGVDSNQLAEALSFVLPLLPLDARACAACVCPAWRAATMHPALWEELDFERCAAKVGRETLALLCARAGAALRTLIMNTDACALIALDDILDALRDGGCSGIRCLCWIGQTHLPRYFSVAQLIAVCPMLQSQTCAVLSHPQNAKAPLGEPQRPRAFYNLCYCHAGTSLTQLMAVLRINATLKSLFLSHLELGDAGATQLAEHMRGSSTLTSLKLSKIDIGDAGAVQLAECFRANTTLTRLDLKGNPRISGVGKFALVAARPPQCTLICDAL